MYELKLRNALLVDIQKKKLKQYKKITTDIQGLKYYDIAEDATFTARDVNRVFSLPENPDEYFWLDFLKELP